MKKRPKIIINEIPKLLENLEEKVEINKININDNKKKGIVIENKDEFKIETENKINIQFKIHESNDGGSDFLDSFKSDRFRKTTTEIDYQLPICKDYLDTGYCTFGSACKFLHTRDKILPSYVIERRNDKNQFKEVLNNQIIKDEDDLNICKICHNYLNNPVELKCGHIFCGECAFQRYLKDKNCFVCGKSTDGIFKRKK